MTDAELARYLGIEKAKDRDKILAALSPRERAGYERLALTELGIKMWLAGEAERPKGVIICDARRRRRR